ncbi:hypothetical protein FHS90_002594 [Rufibacter quisquiliarum]|uniref:Uncharacterized protein n=1 Tax=Rufibacter quisquiliarum TaxID=1549639 RepID=A0A839GQT9_9BACT|nr:hypothetical protein [Rufibacter quisquiliarum]
MLQSAIICFCLRYSALFGICNPEFDYLRICNPRRVLFKSAETGITNPPVICFRITNPEERLAEYGAEVTSVTYG